MTEVDVTEGDCDEFAALIDQIKDAFEKHDIRMRLDWVFAILSAAGAFACLLDISRAEFVELGGAAWECASESLASEHQVPPDLVMPFVEMTRRVLLSLRDAGVRSSVAVVAALVECAAEAAWSVYALPRDKFSSVVGQLYDASSTRVENALRGLAKADA